MVGICYYFSIYMSEYVVISRVGIIKYRNMLVYGAQKVAW